MQSCSPCFIIHAIEHVSHSFFLVRLWCCLPFDLLLCPPSLFFFFSWVLSFSSVGFIYFVVCFSFLRLSFSLVQFVFLVHLLITHDSPESHLLLRAAAPLFSPGPRPVFSALRPRSSCSQERPVTVWALFRSIEKNRFRSRLISFALPFNLLTLGCFLVVFDRRFVFLFLPYGFQWHCCALLIVMFD